MRSILSGVVESTLRACFNLTWKYSPFVAHALSLLLPAAVLFFFFFPVTFIISSFAIYDAALCSAGFVQLLYNVCRDASLSQ